MPSTSRGKILVMNDLGYKKHVLRSQYLFHIHLTHFIAQNDRLVHLEPKNMRRFFRLRRWIRRVWMR